MAHMDARRESARGWSWSIAKWSDTVCAVGKRFRAGLPVACALCRGPARGDRLCLACAQQVTGSMQANIPRCMRCCLALGSEAACSDCAFHAPAFDRIIAGFDYLAPADTLIHYLKVQKQFTLAPLLAGLLADAVRNAQPALPHDAILVPVPASRASLLQRGFNPAAEVARCLAKELGVAYRPALLRRTHDGLKQAQLARLERARSVQRLYACTQKLDGATIAVVDDVLTTGSTLNSIARELRSAGAATVCGLVLARTPWQR